MAHRRVRLSVILSLAVGLPLSSVPAFAGGFGVGSAGGGGHAGGFGGVPSGRAWFTGAPNGYAASRRSGPVQPQSVSRAEMNRQLILPSDPNFPSDIRGSRESRFHGQYRQAASQNGFIQGGFFKDGYSGNRKISRDRYGNPYGFGLGSGFNGGTSYGYAAQSNGAQAYGQVGNSGYASYGEGDAGSFAYAPPRIIEISTEGGRQMRSQATYNGGRSAGGRASGRSLPIVTYGPSSASRATVGPEPGNAYAGGPDLFAPRIVRVRVPKG